MTCKGYDGNTADEQMNDSATEKYSSYQRMLLFAQSKAANSWTKHARSVKTICAFILILVYFAYFGYALYYRYVLIHSYPETCKRVTGKLFRGRSDAE